MPPQKVSAYGGLLKVTKQQYIWLQIVVFAVIAVLFAMTYTGHFNDRLFGNTRVALLVVAALELAETVYIFRKFSKLPDTESKQN